MAPLKIDAGRAILLWAVTFLLSACAITAQVQPKPEPAPAAAPGHEADEPKNPGSVVDGVYTNQEFGLTLPVPASWRSHPRAERGMLDVQFATPDGPCGIDLLVFDTTVFSNLAGPIERLQDKGRVFKEVEPGGPATLGGLTYRRTLSRDVSNQAQPLQERFYSGSGGWRIIVIVDAPDHAALDRCTGPLGKLQFSPTHPRAVQSVRVSSAVSAGALIKKVQPRYPLAAHNQGIQGSVILNAVIGKDGKIKNLHVASGPPALIDAALEAVQQWEYRPYYLEGNPVEVETTIQVNFVLGH